MDNGLIGFSAAQQRALCDLLVLAMYADGPLTSIEDEPLQKLLALFGHTEEFDAAVTGMSPLAQTIQKAKEHTLVLADGFTTRSQQKQVYGAVQQIMTSDEHESES